jgi:hypothetical protein
MVTYIFYLGRELIYQQTPAGSAGVYEKKQSISPSPISIIKAAKVYLDVLSKRKEIALENKDKCGVYPPPAVMQGGVERTQRIKKYT